jgi:hypothetical protein
MVSSFEAEPDPEAGLPILIRQLCQSTGYHEIEFGSIVRRVISHLLQHRRVQYLVVVVNIIASHPDGQSQLK